MTAQRNPACVLPLEDGGAADPAVAGAKAACLARLRAAGFPVPDGVVVTTAAFAAHLRALEGAEDRAAALRQAPLPAAVDLALRAALEGLGPGPVAVRSSGVAEDLPGASFAGQYTTVLGVSGPEAVADAVRRCWASAFGGPAERYREARGLAGGAVAVLIQPMIEAEAAGVAFTANPVTGDPAETCVSAVRGLGERLVSGEARPDEWVVREGRAVCLAAPEGAAGAEEVLAVAELARRAERALGAPQDVEWAIRGGEVFLLQARPITSLPAWDAAEPTVPPAGFWQRADSHYPRPLSAFARSVLLPAANRGFRRMCSEFSLLMETVEEREIGGWVYLRAVPPGGRDVRPPPAWLFRLLRGLVPSLRRRVRDCVAAMRADLAGGYLQRWEAEWRHALEERLDALREIRLEALPDAALAAHAGEVVALLDDCQEMHMLLNHSLNQLLAEFAFTCRELLGWEEEHAFEMLLGLSGTSVAPARALWEVGQRVRGSPVLLERLRRGGAEAADEMCAADASFAAALAAYRRDFGERTLRYEVSEPTLAEQPDLLLALLADQLRRDYDPAADEAALAARRAAVRAEARQALASRPPEWAPRFARALERAERAYPIREEHGFYDTMMPLALVRRVALELGRRLAERGQIEAPADVFHLELAEASAALGEGTALRERVGRRRAERARALARPGPPRYGRPPAGAPPLRALPAEARLAHEAVLWAFERVFATDAGPGGRDAGGCVRGIGASAGTRAGTVRVIREESEFHRLRAGDVLVCPITSPVWSVLFPSVGALVTDSGGFLSHAAIIAREYRVPAVVATGNATEVLRDGQVVRVDGRAGTVVVHRP